VSMAAISLVLGGWALASSVVLRRHDRSIRSDSGVGQLRGPSRSL
jgi:hypothetical protein